MSKELEAFRDILGILSAVSGCEVDVNSERVIIVKQALLKAQEQEKVLKIIKEHKLLNYVFKNPKCAKMYNLKQEEIDLLKEVIK